MGWLGLMVACTGAPTTPATEPLDLPEDPAAAGVPVGVRTEQTPTGLTVEVWYPAADEAAGKPGEVVDFGAWIPASVTDLLGPVEVEPVPTIAVRDAPTRPSDERFPVVVFSHGFGGTRTQSVDLTTHWASRGYVVVATDHAGRSLPDVLPCTFVPPAEGCAIALDDPAVADVLELLVWLDDPPAWLGAVADPSRLGLAGHSMGATTTTTLATDDRFDVLIPMAGGAEVVVDTPTLRIAGTCDGVIPATGTLAAHEASAPSETYVELVDAGHLAFTDLCPLDLAGLAETELEGRDDVNTAFLADLVALASDGCPGATVASDLEGCGGTFAPLEVTGPLLRRMTTLALDEALRGQDGGDLTGGSPDAVVR